MKKAFYLLNNSLTITVTRQTLGVVVVTVSHTREEIFFKTQQQISCVQRERAQEVQLETETATKMIKLVTQWC